MKKYIVGVGIFALILLSISLRKMKNNEEGSITEKNTLYYTQYISDRIGLHLDLNNLEIWDCNDLFMDSDLSLKAHIVNSINLDALSGNKYWAFSNLPDEFTTEHILSREKYLDNELIEYTEKNMCYWFYKDKYYEYYKKKAFIAGIGTNYSYKSPNYIFCVINLEKSLLYFYEYDS